MLIKMKAGSMYESGNWTNNKKVGSIRESTHMSFQPRILGDFPERLHGADWKSIYLMWVVYEGVDTFAYDLSSNLPFELRGPYVL